MPLDMEMTSPANWKTLSRQDSDYVPKSLVRSATARCATTDHQEDPEEPVSVARFLTKNTRAQSFIHITTSRLLGQTSPQPAGSPDDGKQLISKLEQAISLTFVVSRCLEASNQFCKIVTGKQDLKDLQKMSWEWYIAYLDARVSEVWLPVVVPVVVGLAFESLSGSYQSRALVYEVLAVIAESLEKKKPSSLFTIVQDLKFRKLIKSDCRELAYVFVFQFTGWITSFWDPALDASRNQLSLRQNGHTTRRQVAWHSPTVSSSKLPMTEHTRPLYQLLGRFGSLIPSPVLVQRKDSAGGIEAGQEVISATYLSFDNLQADLNIQIEWTSTMNQHLELDQSKNILYVFRFPSVCRLMYRDEEGTLLAPIYRDWSAQHEDEKDNLLQFRNVLRRIKIEDYFVEVLLSYDLIFGRSAHSCTSAKRLLSKVKDEWTETGSYDPLLEILCTKPSKFAEIKNLHKLLEARDYKDYIPIEEFTFLGERLINLQRLSMSQNPHGWRRLWNDRRNISTWIALWAVVIFGGGTLILQGIQLVFQILQIWPPQR